MKKHLKSIACYFVGYSLIDLACIYTFGHDIPFWSLSEVLVVAAGIIFSIGGSLE